MLASRLSSFDGLHVADLFAGTGALGLEALSRGAAHCTFVEQDRGAVDILRRNIEKLGAAERADVRQQPVAHVPPPARPLDLVLIDPPYGEGLAEAALAKIAAGAWLAPGAWLSVELGREQIALPATFSLEAERRFGKATILILRNAG